jgi:hypothetical protein
LYDTAPPSSSTDRPSASIISNEFSFKPDLQHARNPQLADELKQLNVQLQVCILRYCSPGKKIG